MLSRLTTFCLFTVAAAAAPIDFSRQIRPILSENCFFCHGPDEKKREAGLRLDDETAAKSDNEGVIAVVPGAPEKSALYQRMISTDPDEVMPPPKQHKIIPTAQLELVKQWIAEGAKWGKHWSYEKVVRPAVPKNGFNQPIDAFLAQRLTQEGLKFSEQADPATLLRRVALDLTGLPPTLEELAQFGSSAETFPQMVDHFLKKPGYGEHWARQWLDLARYADSSGYPSDQPREIWAYRDWVIRALNANLPFDQFTIHQLAGDLLPNPTDDQLIATAFHRNTMTQNEGGTDDEEFRNAAIIDRVNTTFAVWMGTTMACAQCHTHKYDPLTIKDYFQFYAILNQSADSDKKDEAPFHSLLTDEQKRQQQRLTGEIAKLEAKFNKPEASWLAGLAAWDQGFARDLGWQSPRPAKVTLESKQTATVQADGFIEVPNKTDRDSYTLDLPITGDALSAVKLDTQPRAGFGNFVLTDLKAEVIPPVSAPAPSARFVRIELPGKKRMLQLAEVEVFSAGTNVATQGVAKQSSVYTDAQAKRANDGRTDGDYAKGSVAHTSGNDDNPWWEVDLKSARAIDRVVVWNRTDGNTSQRLDGFQVVLLNEQRQTVWKSPVSPTPAKEKSFSISGPVPVSFTTALADYEQSGFTAASVLRPKSKTDQGWAVAGAADQPHTLTLMTNAPVKVAAGSTLRVSLVQHSEHKQHVLGRFRLSYTGDSRVQQAANVPQDIAAALAMPAPKRTPDQQKKIVSYFVRNVATPAVNDRQKLASLQKELAAMKPTTVPIMRDLAGKDRRITKIQQRGNWQDLGEVVTEATPAVFHPLPKNESANRLAMAQWLVSRDNPLTARVTVNRLWESIFGTGIVRSSEEFGSQGDLPFHPELLDWLAAELMEKNWDLQHILRLMLNSQAYRQTARCSDALIERDPDNRLLARGPRFRPSGEQLRDQALAVSGLLSSKVFGPPVRPMAPNLGLSTAFGRSNDWITSEGEDKHRRSLYTEVRRNGPYASFMAFDAGNREVCMIRRGRTNTPLQAFVTLNDPVFLEAHQAMARRLVAEEPNTDARLKRLYQLTLSRLPIEKEVATLKQLHTEALATAKADLTAATKLATDPIGPAPAGSDIAELAAWTTVANVVMNADEFLMRR